MIAGRSISDPVRGWRRHAATAGLCQWPTRRRSSRSRREGARPDRRRLRASRLVLGRRCRRRSPVPFHLDDVEITRLRPGMRTRVSGGLLGAQVRFELETFAADPTRVLLRARGPIEILVDYALSHRSPPGAASKPSYRSAPSTRASGDSSRAPPTAARERHARARAVRIAHEAETERPATTRRNRAAPRRGGRADATCVSDSPTPGPDPPRRAAAPALSSVVSRKFVCSAAFSGSCLTAPAGRSHTGGTWGACRGPSGAGRGRRLPTNLRLRALAAGEQDRDHHDDGSEQRHAHERQAEPKPTTPLRNRHSPLKRPQDVGDAARRVVRIVGHRVILHSVVDASEYCLTR